MRNRRKPLDRDQLAEVASILRDACRADPETLVRVATELRAQVGEKPRLQTEIDAVIASWRRQNREEVNAMGPNGPVGPGPVA